jgi:hypothetical protein
MEKKYYTTKKGFLCLSVATHPGTLTELDIQENIMRMMVMNDEVSAEEASELISKMPWEKKDSLWKSALQEYWEPSFQEYLCRTNLIYAEDKELFPITEILKEEDEDSITEEIALERMWEKLEEYNFKEFMLWEFPVTEWD